MKRKRTSRTQEVRLPYSRPVIEGMLEYGRGAIPLEDSQLSGFVNVTREKLSESTYGNITGPLKALSDMLGKMVSFLNPDGSNYRDVLKDWASVFMFGIMSYGNGPIKPIPTTLARYEELYDKYESTLIRAFICEDVSADNNYENLEFLGDATYKNALVFYLYRELRIQNKSIATVLKHTHENTKALSDLAKIFHMEPLILSKGTKKTDSLHEDVFESVLGAFQLLQWEIQRDTSAPEAAEFAADNGVANRLVRMIFKHSDARRDFRIPAKTFMETLRGLFANNKDEMKTVEKCTADSMIIVIATVRSVVSKIALSFGADMQKLSKVLNCRYESADPTVDAKHFSSTVYNDLVSKLEELGIGQTDVQSYKNRAIAPKEFHERLNQLAVRATEKGYWIGLNVPKAVKARGTLGIHATLYHDDPRRPIRRAEAEGYGMVDRMNVFTTLFDKLEEIINLAKPIPRKTASGGPGVEFKLSGAEDDNHMLNASPNARVKTLKPQWAADAATTAIDSGMVLHTGVAGTNLDTEAAGKGMSSRPPTAEEEFMGFYSGKPHYATISYSSYEEAVTNAAVQRSIVTELTNRGDVTFMTISKNAAHDDYVIIVISCQSRVLHGRVFGNIDGAVLAVISAICNNEVVHSKDAVSGEMVRANLQ